MRIVEADGSRLTEVEPLFIAMHEHHRAGKPQAAAVRGFRTAEAAWERRRGHYERLLASGKGHLLLAEKGGRAIGYAVVSEGGGEATLTTGDRVAELESLSVLPGERGAGVGRALMEAAYDVMRRLGLGELALYVMDGNASALGFYERLGLRPYLSVLLGEVPPAGSSRAPA